MSLLCGVGIPSDKLNMEPNVGGGDTSRWRTKSIVREGGRLMPSSGTKVSLSGRMRENSLETCIRRMSVRREPFKIRGEGGMREAKERGQRRGRDDGRES